MSAPTKWTPTDRMLELLRTAQDAKYEISVSTLCGETELNRRTYYEYFDNPNFVEWWQAQADRYFALQVSRLSAVSMSRALGKTERGSTADTRLMLERHDKGFAPRSRQEVTGAGGEPLKTYVQVDIAGVVEGKKPEDSNGDGKTSMD